ncbi:hypothetical protein ACTHGU_05255 [Chitinophagaceae bacterium MMS25-I14]
MGKNSINVNGGKFTANVVSLGDHSTIRATDLNTTTNENETTELIRLIDELTDKLGNTPEPVKEKDDVLSSIAILKSEISKEKPNKVTLAGIGKAVLENLKYVKDVAPIAHLVWDKIAAWMG